MESSAAEQAERNARISWLRSEAERHMREAEAYNAEADRLAGASMREMVDAVLKARGDK